MLEVLAFIEDNFEDFVKYVRENYAESDEEAREIAEEALETLRQREL